MGGNVSERRSSAKAKVKIDAVRPIWSASVVQFGLVGLCLSELGKWKKQRMFSFGSFVVILSCECVSKEWCAQVKWWTRRKQSRVRIELSENRHRCKEAKGNDRGDRKNSEKSLSEQEKTKEERKIDADDESKGLSDRNERVNRCTTKSI